MGTSQSSPKESPVALKEFVANATPDCTGVKAPSEPVTLVSAPRTPLTPEAEERITRLFGPMGESVITVLHELKAHGVPVTVTGSWEEYLHDHPGIIKLSVNGNYNLGVYKDPTRPYWCLKRLTLSGGNEWLVREDLIGMLHGILFAKENPHLGQHILNTGGLLLHTDGVTAVMRSLPDLIQVTKCTNLDQAKEVLKKTAKLVDMLFKAGFEFGDSNPSNFLWSEETKQVYVCDLAGFTCYRKVLGEFARHTPPTGVYEQLPTFLKLAITAFYSLELRLTTFLLKSLLGTPGTEKFTTYLHANWDNACALRPSTVVLKDMYESIFGVNSSFGGTIDGILTFLDCNFSGWRRVNADAVLLSIAEYSTFRDHLMVTPLIAALKDRFFSDPLDIDWIKGYAGVFSIMEPTLSPTLVTGVPMPSSADCRVGVVSTVTCGAGVACGEPVAEGKVDEVGKSLAEATRREALVQARERRKEEFRREKAQREEARRLEEAQGVAVHPASYGVSTTGAPAQHGESDVIVTEWNAEGMPLAVRVVAKPIAV